MKFRPAIYGIFFFNFFVCLPAMAMLDSLRVEERNGKQYIIHQVSSGETLYGVSRRYQADIETIKATNNLTGNSLNLGQIIAIPYTGKIPATPSKAVINQQIHTVKSGETLYSISRLYDLSIDEIKSLNKLSGNSLELGQQLVVKKSSAQANPPKSETKIVDQNIGLHTVAPSETLFSISRKYEMSVDDLKALNGVEVNSLSVGQELKVRGGAAPNVIIPPSKPGEVVEEREDIVIKDNVPTVETKLPTRNDTVIVPEPPVKYGNSDKRQTTGDGYEQIVEEGFAMKIENSPNTQKYLALHRTLPIGKIIQVRNQMNNQSIFVRVIGKLPDTGVNKNILIRLSDQAFERLGAIDPKIPIEITYLP